MPAVARGLFVRLWQYVSRRPFHGGLGVHDTEGLNDFQRGGNRWAALVRSSGSRFFAETGISTVARRSSRTRGGRHRTIEVAPSLREPRCEPPANVEPSTLHEQRFRTLTPP